MLNNELYKNILEVLVNSVGIYYMYNAIALFWGASNFQIIEFKVFTTLFIILLFWLLI